MAGYAWPGKVAHRLVGKSGIRAAIEKRVAGAAMSADEVLARISEIATGSLERFLTIKEDGSYEVDLNKAKKAKRLGLLKKVKANRYGVEIELHSSLEALDRLAKYHGLYDDKPQGESGKAFEAFAQFFNALRQTSDQGGGKVLANQRSE